MRRDKIGMKKEGSAWENGFIGPNCTTAASRPAVWPLGCWKIGGFTVTIALKKWKFSALGEDDTASDTFGKKINKKTLALLLGVLYIINCP